MICEEVYEKFQEEPCSTTFGWELWGHDVWWRIPLDAI